jgi:DNA-binding MarR family transcriptional regulator
MQHAHRAAAFTPTSQSLLKQAEALKAQAAELADIITQADNEIGVSLAGARGAAALATGIIRARSQRSKFLPASLFAEPAWDILLELYSAELAQRRVTVSQLSFAARTPATTALRWLSTLEAAKLVERQSDPLDARRCFISLSARGRQAMESFFASIKNAWLAA